MVQIAMQRDGVQSPSRPDATFAQRSRSGIVPARA
jgi:hypothetical protein